MKTTMNIGTMELRNLYERYMTEGLMIAGLFHFTVIGGIQLYLHSSESIAANDPPRRLIRTEIYLPPTIGQRMVLPNVTVAKAFKNNIGVPIPVPETEINPDATIPTQPDMNGSPGIDNGVERGTGTIISNGTIIEREEAPPKEFNPGIEKYPGIISNPAPSYPDIARRAGVEGTVHIKMWVTKEGKVKQAEVVKSTSDIFNQNAIDAAMLWKFTPALMNNGPVSVWVTVPFKFRLKM